MGFVLQRVTVCCSVLQCVAVCCSGDVFAILYIQSRDDIYNNFFSQDSFRKQVALCCSVLQRFAACCRVVQCVADLVLQMSFMISGWFAERDLLDQASYALLQCVAG